MFFIKKYKIFDTNSSVMDKIEIFDNFLEESDILKCIEITCQPQWEFGHNSGADNFRDTPFWIMDLKQNDFISIYIKSKIEEITKKKYILKRVYANGQTYGQHGSYHQDDTTKNCWTFCLYVNRIDTEDIDYFDGYFQVKLPGENKYVISIEPLFNRGVLFPSHYFHRGNAFTRYVKEMRVCIAWKLQEL